MLFNMVSGYVPFDEPTKIDLYRKILSLDYKVPNYFSDNLTEFLCRIFTRYPKNRISISKYCYQIIALILMLSKY